jgi:hypothetical protein
MLPLQPSGEDTVTDVRTRHMSAADMDVAYGGDLYADAHKQLTAGAAGADRIPQGEDSEGYRDDFSEKPMDEDFLAMVREAETQATTYMNQVNRRSWTQSYRAWNNKHFQGSKYDSEDFRSRSRFFVPQTRKAVRKDMAAVSASLFGTIDAVTIAAGNEGDPKQRGGAAVIQELVNYRTNRKSAKASIPWFHVAMGARHTSEVAGFCLSKQSWKLELRRKGKEEVNDEETGEKKLRDVWVPDVDRPNIELIPPENAVIDPAADWTNPIQDAAYVFIKFPMRIDEIRKRQRDPRRPWKPLTESQLRGTSDRGKFDMEAIRRARENGIDRFSDVEQNRKEFDIIWVYDCYIRVSGEDWNFLSVADRLLLTDVEPTRQVYPEQFGERPLVMGYGSLEPFRIYPTSPVESWQPLQQEINDTRNLSLDAVKQNVQPVTKVVRGRQIDLDALKRRSYGSAILVSKPDDVTWEHVPDIGQGVQAMKQYLDIDFDDLAGQSNYGSVQTNNALGKTLGGLQLAAGAANAVQEFDIRVWIETWTEPALAQIVRLEQFYESDPIILALCGERAKLMEKFGISKIDNDLMEQEVTLNVSIGLGAGDPQQRLGKFSSASQIVIPICETSPDFKSGKYKVNIEAVFDEVFGAAGFRDGGKRFLIEGPEQSNPMQGPELDALQAKAAKDKAMAKKAVLDALTNAARVGLDVKALELDFARESFDQHHRHVDQVGQAQDMGHQHGLALGQLRQAAQNVAMGLGPDGQPATQGGPAGPPGGANGVAGPPVAGPPQASQPPGGGPPGEQPGIASAPATSSPAPGGVSAGEKAALEKKTAKPTGHTKHRKIAITKRDEDGRASEFSVGGEEE